MRAEPVGDMMVFASDHRFHYLDVEQALEYTGGDTELLRDLACSFAETIPETLATLHGSDPDELRRAAHSLKGNLRMFGANVVADEAELLEQTTADLNLASVPQLVARLDALVPSFCTELNRFIQAEIDERSHS